MCQDHVTVTVMSIGVDCKNVPAEPSLIVLLTYRSLVGLCKQEVTNVTIIASEEATKRRGQKDQIAGPIL